METDVFNVFAPNSACGINPLWYCRGVSSNRWSHCQLADQYSIKTSVNV